MGVFARLRLERQPVAPPPASAIEADETQREVLAALSRLGSDDQEVIRLRYFLDLTELEIATVLDIRPGTVKSRLSRARGRLRLVIEASYPDLADLAVARREESRDA